MDTASTSMPKNKEETNNSSDATFECNICFDSAKEPVITMCGHLFCWPCIYKWLELHENQVCPICKAAITRDKLIPLYGRGTENPQDPRNKPAPGSTDNIPNRPPGQRTEAPPNTHTNPFGAAQFGFSPFQPMGGSSFNVGFGFGGFGIFPSLFGLQFSFPPQSTNPTSNTGNINANGIRQPNVTAEQEQQAFLSQLLLILGGLILICLLC